MEIWVDRNGNRVRPFGTPYIDQSECYKNVFLYNPNGTGQCDGLYQYPFGELPCKNMSQAVHSFVRQNPMVRPTHAYSTQMSCPTPIPLYPQYRC